MKKVFQIAEPYFFYFIVFLHCLPVLIFKIFVTHDGPAHVYNATLIRNIFFNNDALASDFFSFRSFPEPNWTGHAWMVLLSFIFSATIAERVLLLSYLVLLPVAFRKCIQITNPASRELSYLIFPFAYSYAFYGGLYNFMLGMPLLLLAVLFLLRRTLPLSVKDFIFLFLISLLLYFSHLLIFGIFVLLTPFLLMLKNVNPSSDSSTGTPKTQSKIFKNIFPVMLVLLPCLGLSITFLFQKISLAPVTTRAFSQNLFIDLITVIPTISLDGNKEQIYGILFGLVFLFLIMAVLIGYRNNRSELAGIQKNYFNYSAFWLVASCLMLVFYFVIPDDFATGGVVKVRFAYFFFIFLIHWLATQKIPDVILKIAAAFVVVLSLGRLYYFVNSSTKLNKDAEIFYSASELIEPNSIVLPLNYSDNWMHSNMSNYLGINRSVIVLDNYEAGREHFPLTWKENRNPVSLMGSFNGDVPLCADVGAFEKTTGKKINYIILWKYDHELKDSCSVMIQYILKKNYTLVFKTLDKQLYMYKRADS